MRRTAKELAEFLRAELEGDGTAVIESVSNPESARVTDLIYVDGEKFRERAQSSAARCVLAPAQMSLPGKVVIRLASPKLAFAKAAAWIAPRRRAQAGVHPTAVVSAKVKIGDGAAVGPFVVIEEDAVIGAGAEIGAYCFIGRGSKIGEECHLYPRVTLYEGVEIGRRTIIHSGTVIGGDGFGYVYGEGLHWKFPQIGGVQVGEDVEIGCNTAIDRGSLDTTRIGRGAKIDNLVQVAHNVEIGENSVIASQTGISGSCRIGKNVMLGGQVGLGDHCTLEDGVIAGGQAGILPGKIVGAGQVIWGTPARPFEKFKEQHAWIARLPELGKKLRKIANT